ncbi:MAG: carbamate kinase [Gammaproteobacteria bacterium]|nr:carbamate kinase [Gammaproteobacteria bacterium]
MKQPWVVSLGGNAFARPGEELTMAGQFEFADRTLAPLAASLDLDRPLLVTHGNGPQVGYILTRVEEALGKAYALPLEVCVAESEGEIGYVLQQTLHNLTRGQRPVAALLTQVRVAADDPAFDLPSKPIGPWFDPPQAATLASAGLAMVYDKAGRGRRLVPSPRPIEIVELPVIRQLLALGIIVIAAGGGGIPVIDADAGLEGVEAVVDKDLASALLAIGVGAGQLVMVTGVAGAFIDFDTESARLVTRATPDQMAGWLAAGHFPPGTMGPKVEAAIQFVRATGGRAVICQPADLAAALAGEAGTVVEQAGAI